MTNVNGIQANLPTNPVEIKTKQGTIKFEDASLFKDMEASKDTGAVDIIFGLSKGNFTSLLLKDDGDAVVTISKKGDVKVSNASNLALYQDKHCGDEIRVDAVNSNVIVYEDTNISARGDHKSNVQVSDKLFDKAVSEMKFEE